MMRTVSEFPKHPLPEAPRPVAQPPTVIVYERAVWEYKVVRKGAGEAPLTEDDLNTLGKAGWELVAAVTSGSDTHFYLKRTRS